MQRNEPMIHKIDKQAAVLLMDRNDESVFKIVFPDKEVLAGRCDRADLRIDDPTVSRFHARFVFSKGQLFVEDLNSHNGTWVKGKRINRTTLVSGEALMLGHREVTALLLNSSYSIQQPRSITATNLNGLVVADPEMLSIYQQVEEMASHDTTVLILGETGTGKEQVARALHAWGNRSSKPFRVINCGAIPDHLIASILFGHEKGSFTGATDRHIGAFEHTDGGVILLDEIGELTLAAQSVILRVLDDKQITRVGSSREFSVDVRILATTNRSLAAMVEEGTFRRDLFYRLNRLTLTIPPLRQRRAEIPLLINLFQEAFCKSYSRSIGGFQPEALEVLERFTWPGNIRQLRNVIESAVLRCKGDTIGLFHLPDYVINNKLLPKSRPTFGDKAQKLRDSISLKDQLSLWEVQLIRHAMNATAGDRTAASRLLRIPVRTLSYKLKLHGLVDTDWSKKPVDELLS